MKGRYHLGVDGESRPEHANALISRRTQTSAPSGPSDTLSDGFAHTVPINSEIFLVPSRSVSSHRVRASSMTA